MLNTLNKFEIGGAKEWLANNLYTWFRDNIDFAFILAAFTETPRWTVVFSVIHEPAWIGIPLGILMAFATAKAWRKFFITQKWWLFWFNISCVIIAIFVISPVLYAMTSVASSVSLNQLPYQMRIVWVIALAISTFLPLVQLAAVQEEKICVVVKDRKNKIAKNSKQDIAKIKDMHNAGKTVDEIALLLNKSTRTIYNYLKKSEV